MVGSAVGRGSKVGCCVEGESDIVGWKVGGCSKVG
jgi:hypothetical protein